jgi:succinate-acetate transporter protein
MGTEAAMDASQQRLLSASRIMFRPIASSLPLAMVALAGGSIIVTGSDLQWVPTAEAHVVALIVLVFTVPLQALSSAFGYLGRDGTGGTGPAILSGAWAVIGASMLMSAPGHRSPAMGLLLLFIGGALLVPVTASSFGKVGVAVTYFLALTRFVLTGVYEFHGGMAWKHASGWIGVAVCVVALYMALALEIEDIRHHTVLPVGRWGSGARAMGGNLLDEIEKVQREAGVREQL